VHWDTGYTGSDIQGQLGHRASWDTGPVGTQGQLGHRATWDTRAGTCSGIHRLGRVLGHRATWDTRVRTCTGTHGLGRILRVI